MEQMLQRPWGRSAPTRDRSTEREGQYVIQQCGLGVSSMLDEQCASALRYLITYDDIDAIFHVHRCLRHITDHQSSHSRTRRCFR